VLYSLEECRQTANLHSECLEPVAVYIIQSVTHDNAMSDLCGFLPSQSHSITAFFEWY